ncbi:hypothetical protein PO498_15315 [Klebsiella variicola]|uniref:hypothetical protein n=1 Tax=Klebsiella TaxID=570 RepID=UPI0013A5B6F6|nr:hypothetical protein [Klebsiella variicola]MBD0721930.1 hypothetical protein [Klebsiella variicola]MCK6050561.1 hypothetical protein [Klebsiella variicola]HCF8180491.1 hypothetical protein [Klebsiella variicola]HED1713368.1 hypothetical protein [Klebsiella variicola subsp. variicola]
MRSPQSATLAHWPCTAGVGLSPFNVVHPDITGMAGTGSNTYGAVAQLAFTL